MLHLALGAALLASAPPVCNVISYDFQRLHDRSFFVAAPLPDTVQAGSGAVQLGQFPEAPRAGQWSGRVVYGQVVRMERLGGADTAVVESVFRAAGNREAVIVPWEFDAGCRPAAWRGSARWAELGSAGFYVARLRQPGHWAGARPTFDVYFAGRYPYPTGSFFRAAPRPAASLTAEEYFDLYAALPSNRTPYPQRTEAGRRLWGWARANAAIAVKHPAAQILAEVRRYYGWSEADVQRMMAPPVTPPAPAPATGGR